MAPINQRGEPWCGNSKRLISQTHTQTVATSRMGIDPSVDGFRSNEACFAGRRMERTILFYVAPSAFFASCCYAATL